MGIIKRMQNIVTGSIHDMLDKVEDPEAAVNQMIRDMEQALSELKENTASAIATAKMTEKKLEKTTEDQRLWQENAETALQSGDEELAKKALLKRKAIDESIVILNGQLEDAHAISEKLKNDFKFLENKLKEAKVKRDNLVTKKRAAETKQKLHNASEKINGKMDRLAAAAIDFDGFEGFSRFEEKIERQMAEVDALEELSSKLLNREFENMKNDRDLEEALAALKEKIG